MLAGILLVMAKDPAFLFYPGDWLGGTMHLDWESKGAYMDLLMLQFQREKLTLHMVRHMLGHKYSRIWPKISDKFKAEGGRLWNERLRVEKEKRQNYTQSRKKNLKGASDMQPHMAPHMENGNRIEDRIKEALNEILIENLRPLYGHLDFDKEIEGFKAKVIGSPQKYGTYKGEALGLAFMAQLRNGKHKPKEKPGSEFDEKEVLKRIKNQQPQKTDGVGSATSKPGSLE